MRLSKAIRFMKALLKTVRAHFETDRRHLIGGAVISAVLLALVLIFSGTFFQDGAPQKHAPEFITVSVFFSLLAGIFTAFKLKVGNKAARIINTAAFFVMPFGAMLITETLQGVWIYDFSPLATFANYIVFIIAYGIAAVITGTYRLPLLIMTPLLYLGGVAANLVLFFRGTPLMPADVITVGTAMNVISGYHFQPDCYYVMSFTMLVCIWMMLFRLPAYKPLKHERKLVRLVSAIVIAGILLPFYTTDIAAEHNLKPDFWNQERGYHKSGTIMNFMLNTKYLIIERPDDYDPLQVTSIVENLLDESPDDPGIFASAQLIQESIAEKRAAEEAAAQAAANNGDTTITESADTEALASLEPTGAEGDNSDILTEPALPNTGADTPLAVTGTSTLSQPKTSARLRRGQTPNIIFIMNETYSDLRVLGGFETNQDYMPFTRSLTKNTIKGNVYVPVNGAGTSNSEFEALTGNSMAFLTGGSNAYELYVKNKLSSLVWTLEAHGFSRSAFHTYYGNSWKRSTVYPLIGFENFTALEELLGEDLVNSYHDGDITFFDFENEVNTLYPEENVLLRRFVSDYFDFRTIEEMFEQRDESKPFFLFNVTMQNHGSYDTGYANFDQQIMLMDNDTFYPKTNRYLSLIYESDQALQELVDYFDSISEPVMIVMFGDHQPSIEEEFIESLLGSDLSNLTTQQQQKRYATPFLIWTNYRSESGYIDMMSSNYLSTLILQQAGISGTIYNDYLSAMYSRIPVIDTTGYITADGEYHTYDEVNEYTDLLNGYKKVQYNNMFDALFRCDDIFYYSSPEAATAEQ